VAPVDELPLVVRLPAADTESELSAPLVDPRLELVERQAAVQLRVAAPDDVEVDAVEDVDVHA
jgi:hypothetical protein